MANQNVYHQNKKITLTNETVEVQFKPTGELFHIMSDQTMVNQVEGTNLDPSLNQIYLRIRNEEKVEAVYLLMGLDSNSELAVADQQLRWTGEVGGISYKLYFQLSPKISAWYWNVQLSAKEDVTVDLLYGQDIGIAAKGALQSNEAYVSQYIDHKVIEGDNGYVVSSRQNQPQHGNQFPYLQEGSFNRVISYSTDGFQFFNNSYKLTNKPEAIKQSRLEDEVLQYEFAYTGLLLEPISLKAGESQEAVFYNYYQANHEEPVEEIEALNEIKDDFDSLELAQNFEAFNVVTKTKAFGETLIGDLFTEDELNALYQTQHLLEKDVEGEPLSFFTEDYAHVVLQNKEAVMKRQHGQILLSSNEVSIDQPVISTTSWMAGIFNSQVVLGNTSMNKWITNTRNPLNILKASGQRIYVKVNEAWKLLTVPSVFEIGTHYVKWLYKLEDDVLEVTNYTLAKETTIRLEVKSQSGKTYDFLVTQQVIMNEAENRSPYSYTVKDDLITFKAEEPSIINNVMPDLTYHLKVNSSSNNFTVTNEAELLSHLEDNDQAYELFALNISESEQFDLVIQGNTDASDYKEVSETFEEANQAFKTYFQKLTRQLSFDFGSSEDSLSHKYNALVQWYTHNMLVHYLVPHGLEQYGGAAWGTRDVSQGPIEYFLTMQHFDVVKDIILKLYSHQFEEDGNWPQWFMFDQYSAIQAGESHGDIIVWPLKVVGEYLRSTNDFAILDEKISYMSYANKAHTEEKYSLTEHIQKQMDYINSHYLEGTYLSSYGDGDWDDTLQPHDQRLKSHMASSWTVELTYQSLNLFADAIQKHEAEMAEVYYTLAKNIKDDFNKHILADEVIPGFVYQEESGDFTYMVHPSDTRTNIQYRLLPMIRGMISEMFTPEQANSHYEIIKEHLLFPDGAHLMNRPANYIGGKSVNFKRAEQSSTFGREIGLNYVHAHIRFVEAMAKIGKNELTFEGLETINPILIQDKVPNAETRQSNSYFSSSDAKFTDRYDAAENFSKLKTGDVPVMGGWRIYSSGPGIYLNQLISTVLGIRVVKNGLVIDPVLPENLDGLKLQFAYQDYPVIFSYQQTTDEVTVTINGQQVEADRMENPYRKGGLYLSEEILREQLTDSGQNEITISYPIY